MEAVEATLRLSGGHSMWDADAVQGTHETAYEPDSCGCSSVPELGSSQRKGEMLNQWWPFRREHVPCFTSQQTSQRESNESS